MTCPSNFGDPFKQSRFQDAKLSVVVTRHYVTPLDEFKAFATSFGTTLRLIRLHPSGRAATESRWVVGFEDRSSVHTHRIRSR